MPYSVRGYEERARDCVELAGKAKDALVRMELLKLRQTYLNVAARLRRQGFEEMPPLPSARIEALEQDQR